MSDLIAPVLLGLTLPSVIDVRAGSHATPVSATASDAGGAGVSRVIVYFDQPLHQVQHHWQGFGSKLVVDGLFTNDSFGDATPGSATSVLSLTNLTRSGSYKVAKVAVEDAGGNRTVYATGQLEAMGINTVVQVTGGIDDKVAPTLRALNLPTTLDLGAGQARLTVAGELADTGGSGVAGATIEFDRPLRFSDGERSAIGLGSSLSSIQSGESVAVGSGDTIVTSVTASGTYQVTRLTVTDQAGNASTYTAEQLKALGMNTSLTVTGGSAPAAPGNALLAADSADGFAMTLASPGWTAAGTHGFKLVLRYDPAMTKFAGATLAEGASGSIAADTSAAGTVTITGSGSFAEAAGIRIAMQPLRENHAAYLEVDSFSIDGADQAFSNGKSSWMLQGANGNDLIYPIGGGVADGGAGFDTVMLDGARSSTVVTKTDAGIDITRAGNRLTLVNVERLAFGEDYVVFDTDGAAADAYRLYRAAFDRAPDKTGLGYWISQLEHGAALDTVARGMIESGEFSAGAGSGSSTVSVVTALYRNVFDREPDEAGLNYWSNAIDVGGAHLSVVLAAFSDSGEHRAKLVAQIENGIEYTLW